MGDLETQRTFRRTNQERESVERAQLKLLTIAGARPNFVKVAPFLSAIDQHNAHCFHEETLIRPILVHTGQHYDHSMSEIFFRELRIRPPDICLQVGSGSHAVQTAQIMTRLEQVCEGVKPDWVVVFGDVNSTLAAALACVKLGIRVAHVEAGLRSFDRSMPEEINRIVTDSLADLHLTPSSDANENLRREGIPEQKIVMVGNIMIDALCLQLPSARSSRIGVRLGLQRKRFLYVTLHRPANVDNPVTVNRIASILKDFSRQMPIVFPIHPRTREVCRRNGIPFDGCRVLEPVGHGDSLWLAENAGLVLTDSGGLQEETTYLGTPCLTLRPNTERPITIQVGTNRLTSLDTLRADVCDMLHHGKTGRIPPFWDGKTSERIVHALLQRSMKDEQ